MNPASDLTVIAGKFTKRISKLYADASVDGAGIDRYCLVSISQLNNFLRSYLLSIRTGACDSSGGIPKFKMSFASEELLIDEIVRLGNRKQWQTGKVGTWTQRNEPALHCPHVFLKVVSGLGCSNINEITTAMADSWKIDVLRNVRNYFAHRCISTEQEAVAAVQKRYVVSERAAKILLERDITLAERVVDDVHGYLTDFAKGIC